MSTKRAAVLFGLCAAVCIAVLMKYHGTGAVTADAASPQKVDPASLPTPEVQQPAVPEPSTTAPWSRASGSVAVDEPIYLESSGVVERLQKSRHNFIALPTAPGVPQRPTFRFTLEREPLVDLAYRQQTVGWPINDGGVEFVKLTTVREQDGNLFIGGEVVEGGGQFAMVMTADNSMSGQLLSPRGMYSYNSQLDEIVGQRVEGPVAFD